MSSRTVACTWGRGRVIGRMHCASSTVVCCVCRAVTPPSCRAIRRSMGRPVAWCFCGSLIIIIVRGPLNVRTICRARSTVVSRLRGGTIVGRLSLHTLSRSRRVTVRRSRRASIAWRCGHVSDSPTTAIAWRGSGTSGYCRVSVTGHSVIVIRRRLRVAIAG